MALAIEGKSVDVERRLREAEDKLRQGGLDRATREDALAMIKVVREEWNAKPRSAAALDAALRSILGGGRDGFSSGVRRGSLTKAPNVRVEVEVVPDQTTRSKGGQQSGSNSLNFQLDQAGRERGHGLGALKDPVPQKLLRMFDRFSAEKNLKPLPKISKHPALAALWRNYGGHPAYDHSPFVRFVFQDALAQRDLRLGGAKRSHAPLQPEDFAKI